MIGIKINEIQQNWNGDNLAPSISKSTSTFFLSCYPFLVTLTLTSHLQNVSLEVLFYKWCKTFICPIVNLKLFNFFSTLYIIWPRVFVSNISNLKSSWKWHSLRRKFKWNIHEVSINFIAEFRGISIKSSPGKDILFCWNQFNEFKSFLSLENI